MLNRPKYALSPSATLFAREHGHSSVQVYELNHAKVPHSTWSIDVVGLGTACLTFVAERRLVVVTKDGWLGCYDLMVEEDEPSTTLVWEHDFRSEISAAEAFEREGTRYVLLGDKRGFVICVNVSGKKPDWAIGYGHRDAVLSVNYEPILNHFVSTGRDRLIQIWSGVAKELVGLEEPSIVSASDVLAFFDDVPVPEANQGDEASEVTVGDVMDFFSMAVDESVEEVPDAIMKPEPVAREAKTVAPKVLAIQTTFSGVEGWPIVAEFSHDGRRLATGGMDNAVYLWDLESGQKIASQFAHFGWVVDLEFSADDSVLVSASWDNTVGVFDGLTLEPQVALQGHRDYVSDLVFLGERLISASYDKTVGVWAWRKPKLERLIRSHSDWVQAVGLWRDGVLTISSDGTSRFWSADLECEHVIGVSLGAGFELGSPVEFSEWITDAPESSEAEDVFESSSFRDLRATGFGSSINPGSMTFSPSPPTPQLGSDSSALVTTGEFAAVSMTSVLAAISEATSEKAAAEAAEAAEVAAIAAVELAEAAAIAAADADARAAAQSAAVEREAAEVADAEAAAEAAERAAAEAAERAAAEAAERAAAEAAELAAAEAVELAAAEAVELAAAEAAELAAAEAAELAAEAAELAAAEAAERAAAEAAERAAAEAAERAAAEAAEVAAAEAAERAAAEAAERAAAVEAETRAAAAEAAELEAAAEAAELAAAVEAAEADEDKFAFAGAESSVALQVSEADLILSSLANPSAPAPPRPPNARAEPNKDDRAAISQVGEPGPMTTGVGNMAYADPAEVDAEIEAAFAEAVAVPLVSKIPAPAFKEAPVEAATLRDTQAMNSVDLKKRLLQERLNLPKLQKPKSPAIATPNLTMDSAPSDDSAHDGEMSAILGLEAASGHTHAFFATPIDGSEVSDAALAEPKQDSEVEEDAPSGDLARPVSVAEEVRPPTSPFERIKTDTSRPVLDGISDAEEIMGLGLPVEIMSFSVEESFRDFEDIEIEAEIVGVGAESTKPRLGAAEFGANEEGLGVVSTSAIDRMERIGDPKLPPPKGARPVPGVFEVAPGPSVEVPAAPASGILRRKRKTTVATFVPVAVLKTAHQHVYAVAVSPDGTHVASAGGDNHVCVWGADGGLVHRLRVEHPGINAVAFSPDGSVLAAGGDEGIVHLWLLPTAESGRVRHAQLVGHTAWVTGVDFTADGRYVLSSSYDGTARIWNLERGESVHVLHGHQGPVADISTSPVRTITLGHDGTVRVWNSQWIQVDIFDGFDTLISGGTNGEITAWCAANGDVFRDSEGHPKPMLSHRGQARGIAVGEDGTIVSVGEDTRVMIYNRDSAEPHQSLRTGSACWSVDLRGKHLAVGCDDGGVHVFRIQ